MLCKNKHRNFLLKIERAIRQSFNSLKRLTTALLTASMVRNIVVWSLKAFDNVLHKSLLFKRHTYLIRGNIFSVVYKLSFLSCPKSYVQR